MKNIKDLSKRVSENKNISQKDAHNIIEDTFNEISKILIEEGEEVRIKNFAIFKYGTVPGKKTKHPTTKEDIIIPSKINGSYFFTSLNEITSISLSRSHCFNFSLVTSE